MRDALRRVWKEKADGIYREIIDTLDSGSDDLRPWFRRNLFDEHIKRFSKSRRKAPIYWELATPTHSYAVWLCYHRFTRDTFYKVLNDYVKPKVVHENQKLARMRAEAGTSPTRSQAKGLEAQEGVVSELTTFREEIERIAPLWNSDLNDGVIINFAPLWRLVPQHKAWQKECKSCWDSLIAGDHDWAHLAMHLWPERVVFKCGEDCSVAIAHGLEEVFWRQDNKGKWIAREDVTEAQIDALIAERTKPAVKAALESLLAHRRLATEQRGGGRRRADKANHESSPRPSPGEQGGSSTCTTFTSISANSSPNTWPNGLWWFGTIPGGSSPATLPNFPAAPCLSRVGSTR